MKKIVMLAAVLLVSGCVSNGRSPSPTLGSSPVRSTDPDKPRQLCESTMIGSQPKTICY